MAEPAFALKGGTAINLFEWNLPRLSADIDLTYLPNHDRKESLGAIGKALARIPAGCPKIVRKFRTQTPAVRCLEELGPRRPFTSSLFHESRSC
nr:nucleotidyl transferase AbiEii/AbiGii toxin family protein [Sphingobium sp. BYY-5]